MSISASDRAGVLRDTALELLAKADELDGKAPCTCGHHRESHQTGIGAWTGFCSESDLTVGATEQCDCEAFEPW